MWVGGGGGLEGTKERETETERQRQRDRQTDRQSDRQRELELENFILQELYFRSSQKHVLQLVLAKLLVSKFKITGIICIHAGMNE